MKKADIIRNDWVKCLEITLDRASAHSPLLRVENAFAKVVPLKKKKWANVNFIALLALHSTVCICAVVEGEPLTAVSVEIRAEVVGSIVGESRWLFVFFEVSSNGRSHRQVLIVSIRVRVGSVTLRPPFKWDSRVVWPGLFSPHCRSRSSIPSAYPLVLLSHLFPTFPMLITTNTALELNILMFIVSAVLCLVRSV